MVPRIPRIVAIYGSKVGRGSCLFIDNVAAVNEGRQSIEHREQYVPSKIKFQFRVETNKMQACELKPTCTTFRRYEQ